MSGLNDLIAAVETGYFPADMSASDLGLTGECDGVPMIECLYDAYIGSLDAALRLHEALLPGWDFSVRTEGAAVYHYIDRDDPEYRGKWCRASEYGAAEPPARAFLLAILRALKLQEAGNE